jgi:rare lipoprotein A (peptidoglycan hydrolase)
LRTSTRFLSASLFPVPSSSTTPPASTTLSSSHQVPPSSTVSPTEVKSVRTSLAPRASRSEVQRTTLPTPLVVRDGRASGRASWYRWRAGNCASRTIPRGTVVTVSSNARVGTCRVGDYGPAAWTGRIIDLDATVFEQLAPLSKGVIEVELSW